LEQKAQTKTDVKGKRKRGKKEISDDDSTASVSDDEGHDGRWTVLKGNRALTDEEDGDKSVEITEKHKKKKKPVDRKSAILDVMALMRAKYGCGSHIVCSGKKDNHRYKWPSDISRKWAEDIVST
jgi:hypothetical protein